MITTGTLPDNIKKAVQPFLKSEESFDVFPAKFIIDNTSYYYFTFAPAKEQLIMREDGVSPPLDDIKKVALIAEAYNTSIETIANHGFQWVKSDTKKIYQNFLQLLVETKDMLKGTPSDMYRSIETCIEAAKQIIEEQEKIEDAVEKAIRLGDTTNQKEIATEKDRDQMRQYVTQMGWAAFRQNEIQLETETDRQRVVDYLSSHKLSSPKLFFKYMKLNQITKRMLTSDTREGQRIDAVRRQIEVLEAETLEESKDANEFLKKLRNPR